MSTKITNPCDIKEGMTIRILSKPDTWSSMFNTNRANNSNNFPMDVKITKIQKDEYKYYHACCDNYGWDLNGVVKVGVLLITKNKVNKKQIEMKVVKSEDIEVNGKKRNLTIVVMISEAEVRAGYSIKVPEDKQNSELGEKIATGRALSDRTNLVDMVCGIGMNKKYILYSIAEHLIRQVQRGTIQIKGIH